MKYIKVFTIMILSFFLFLEKVDAAASVSVSSSSIYVGNKVTVNVTLSGVAAWNIKIGVSGAAGENNCGTLVFADSTTDAQNTTKTFSATCTAAKTGTITFTLSGDTTTSGGVNQKVSESKQVTVTNKPVETPKSSVNYLTSLSIDGVTLIPEYDKTVSEYNVELPVGTTSININATLEDSKATVIGNGNQTVTDGINTLEVVVTAENGSKRTYIIIANVLEPDPIEVKVNGENYTIVRKEEFLPDINDFYIPTTVTINGEEIAAYYGEITGYTLIGLKYSDGTIEYYIYDNDKYTLYQEISLNKITIFPLELEEGITIPKVYSKTKITVNDIEVTAYKINSNSKYALIYGINTSTGEKHLYMYDEHDNTLQIYNNEETKLLEDNLNKFLIIIIVLGVLSFVLLSILVGTFIRNRKKLKKEIVNNAINGRI